MIVDGWYSLTRAVDDAVPCYAPMPQSPWGDEGRCGRCDGCVAHGRVEELLSLVESQFEAEFERLEES